ncbi:regulator of nonsense transcripts 2 [Histomonas meleagridis]|uniref:regulator of nonsense transcripts 2 n=1 Tax=Histomonas meleagridis TaxID=135588 RepID=UPI00355A8A20|nr:regulator of nonsense transcripts 2 [Histomonas meleagridis]KAH0796947.1 regulator of nonsense transcripts 2 [Histomonas meleagridis]
MSATIPQEFLRPAEELPLRKRRAELYRKLREENQAVFEKRSNKHKTELDDLFGDFEDEPVHEQAQPMKGGKQAFLKNIKTCYQKLATTSCETENAIIAQLGQIQLTRFMQEAVTNLISAPIKFVDIPSYVHICSILYQKYKDFLDNFQPKLIEEISDKSTPPNRRRILLCAYADLLIVHVLQNVTFFNRIFLSLVNTDINSHEYANYPYIWKIITYAGGDLFGINRGENTLFDAIFKPSECISPSLRKVVSSLYIDIVDQLEKCAKEGMEARDEAYKLLILHGRTNTRPNSLANECKEKYDKLYRMATGFSILMKRTVENYWKEETDTIEFTTPDGIVAIPARYSEMIQKHTSTVPTNNETDTFYTQLANMDERLNEQLMYTLPQIKLELDRCFSVESVDAISKHYLTIDSKENREEIINLFSTISRNKVNQAPYYARFIANISQKIPEIGQLISSNLESSFISYVHAQNNSKKMISFIPKLHIARYISELAKFKVGIDSYFKCLTFALNHFRGKTVDMACTLIFNAGKFLNNLSDRTHIQILSIIEKLKSLKSFIFQPHVLLLVDQAIEMFEPKGNEEVNPNINEPIYNKYQAYAIHVFQQIYTKGYISKAIKTVEKMWLSSNVTHVDQAFVIQLVLDLPNYSIEQLSSLATFVSRFSYDYPEFGLAISDILLERIHRGIERDNISFRQRQLYEIRFLAELIIQQVIPLEVAFTTITLILSLNQPDPLTYLISINNKYKCVQPNTNDFFKVKLVCELLSSLIGVICKSLKDYNIQMMVQQVFYHLQIFCLIRTPIPSETAFNVSDVIELYERKYNNNNQLNTSYKVKQIESINETVRSELNNANVKFITYSPYTIKPSMVKTQVSHQVNFNLSDDDSDNESESENEFDEVGEKNFLRELNEFKEEFQKNKKQPKDITIPIELLSNSNVQLGPEDKMTIYGPPANFNVCVPHKGNSSHIISFK